MKWSESMNKKKKMEEKVEAFLFFLGSTTT
jgi:hypothetical protein